MLKLKPKKSIVESIKEAFKIKNRCCTTRLEVFKLPQVLILAFDRSESSGEPKIDFELDLTDLYPDTRICSKYSLYAMLARDTRTPSCDVVAYVLKRNTEGGVEWLKADKKQVYRISIRKKLRHSRVEILFYQRQV